MPSLGFSARVARTTWRVVPKRALSSVIGWAAGRHIPATLRPLILERFARTYGIDTAQAEKGLADYARVDDFFTRRLRPGARTIDSAINSVVSPADGTVVESGLVANGQLLQVKGVLFDLEELLGDSESANRLDGGAFLTTYLSPTDYHRVHAPVGGKILGWTHIPGLLFPVGATSVAREPGLFVRNERFVTFIDQGDAGLCAVVMVATVGVGNVTAAYDPEVETHGRSFLRAAVRRRRYDKPIAIGKGDEIGTFHMGSTTVVVFAPGRVELEGLSPGQSTQMGQSIGRLSPASSGHE